MLEILNVVELARVEKEKNKIIGSIYMAFVKYKLKKIFFNKFKVKNIDVDNNLFDEFMQFYNCTCGITHSNINRNYCHIKAIYRTSGDGIIIEYYGFRIIYKKVAFSAHNHGFNITAKCNINDNYSDMEMNMPIDSFNISFFKVILLSAIYNYCVSYVYGKNSNMYYDNKECIIKLYNL